VRLQQFGAGRPLWSDEAMLALNIATRSFSELLAPLNHDQYAPVLFLWGERLAVLMGGVSEWSLRTLPLVAGILLILLVGSLTRRLLGDSAALVAVTITAFCPALIFYSNEAKPYVMDGLVAVALVYAAVGLAEQPQSRRALGWLLSVGLLSVWLSAPAVFTLAGVGAGLLLVPSPKRAEWLARILAVGACWSANFLAAYHLLYSRPSRSGYMARFWADTYLGVDSVESVARSWVLVARTLRGLFLGATSIAGSITDDFTMAALLWVIVTGLGLLGGLFLSRRHGAAVACVLILPGFAVAAASGLGVYPIAARFVLFALPLWIILMAGGFAWIAGRMPSKWRPVGLACGALALPLLGLPRDGFWLVRHEQWNGARQVIADLARANAAQHPVYVNARGIPVWLFYTTDWQAPDLVRLRTLIGWNQQGGPAFENASSRFRAVREGEGRELVLRRSGTEVVGLPTGVQLRSNLSWGPQLPDSGWARNEISRLISVGRPQVWLVFFRLSVDFGYVPFTRELDAAGGRVLRRIEYREAAAWLYDLSDVRLAGASR
jgi:hypothetical protein